MPAKKIDATLIRTPVKAPDFAVVSESIPAMPAQNATRNENQSGLEITLDSEWLASEN